MAVEYQALAIDDGEAAEAGPSRWYKPTGYHRVPQSIQTHLSTPRSRLLAILTSISAALIFFSIVYLGPSISFPSVDPDPPDLENGYFQTGDVAEHNDAVAKRLDRCARLGLLRSTSLPSHDDFADEDISESTYIASGCSLNSTTLILLPSIYFAEAQVGATYGESIWATSVMAALNRWGYSYMFTSMGWWNHSMNRTMEVYDRYREQVRMVIADPEQVVMAFGEQRGRCIQSEENPGGIEEWRFLGFNFWDTNNSTYGPAWELPEHPLGDRFTLSPAPSSQTQHFSLPYSVEPTCRHHRAFHSRPGPSKPQAYLMAKKTSYLSLGATSFPYTVDAIADIAEGLGVDVVMGLSEDDDPATGKRLREKGVKDLGKLGKEVFFQHLGESFALVGAGRPFVSPSPWDGLCLGVPFINPILVWDESDPSNRSSWNMQHQHMADLDPPFVYSVHRHDFPALRRALQGALENPFDSYLHSEMTFDAVSRRVAEMVERDWEGIWRQRQREVGGEAG